MLRPYRDITPTVPATCYVDPSAQLIGDVVLGEQSSVWMNAVIRGDVHHIRIGSCTNIQDGAVLHGMKLLHPVIVGDMCTIGHNATVHGCTLEDEVLIGMGAVVLNGARIGTGSIVAAGAVVPEGMQVPPHSLVSGVPARIRRTLTQADLDLIRMYANNYLEYTRTYLAEQGRSSPPK